MTPEQLTRYQRQIILPHIGLAGQANLAKRKVLIVGLGGLGSAAAYYLAAVGVGNLILNDFDKVELSNLQRQILHNPTDMDRQKVESAAEQLKNFNPEINIATVATQLDDDQLTREIERADIVLDCSDNLSTRQQINRVCYKNRKPLVSGAAIRFEGQIVTFDFRSGKGPCYRCFQPEENTAAQTCAESGVVASLVGIIGSTQAMECIRLLLQKDNYKAPELALYDGLQGRWTYLTLILNQGCPVCDSQGF